MFSFSFLLNIHNRVEGATRGLAALLMVALGHIPGLPQRGP